MTIQSQQAVESANQLLLDTQKFRRRAAAVKTRNRFCKQNLDICKISLFPRSKKLPINQLLLDTQKFRSSLFKGSQGRGTESLMGFKGKALNILCSLSGGLCPPLNSFVSNKKSRNQYKLRDSLYLSDIT